MNLSDPIRPVPVGQTVELRAARNEWTSFTLEVSNVFVGEPLSVRFDSPAGGAGSPLAADQLQAYQVLNLPVEVNPGFVRHTGLNTANRSVPRALLPVPVRNGTIALASVRDPLRPADPAAHPNGGTVLLWIDLRPGPQTPAGAYESTCALTGANGRTVGEPVRLRLNVYDFTLPDERHLQMVGEAPWNRLAGLYPQWFGDTITPTLLNRGDPRYERTIRTLDALVTLAERNRASVFVPGLAPSVKWPAGAPARVDWREFDSLVAPWMRGDLFADKVPLAYWPIPPARGLSQYDLTSRMDYWSLAARHFDESGWLDRSSVLLHDPAARPSGAEAEALSAEAAHVLSAYGKVRVTVPLEDGQVGAEVPASDRERVFTSAPGLVSAVQAPAIREDVSDRRHWLRADLPGLVPYAGAGGSERDVRVWTWLAFLRRASLILWDYTLPVSDGADQPADPNAMVWFYPGQWFGVDEPLPTLQLKWLRRAQQDFEYLWLAKDRGEVINALQMARLITKPVEILPSQTPDPAFALMSGTSDPAAWEQAQDLLAKTILLRRPDQPADPARQRALYIQTLQWAEPQERPLLLPRSAQWSREGARAEASNDKPLGNWVRLQLDLDIYNASDVTPDQNQLAWNAPPQDSGWEINRREGVEVPRLQTYHLQPAAITARVNLDRLSPASRSPLELSFVDGFKKTAYPLRVVLPVATSERREGPLSLDGRLNDWSDADALQDGPLVMMLSRPSLQKQELVFAPIASRVYSAWGRENFYVAFDVNGLSPDPHRAHNDVTYLARRAWGEDLCELLVQPVYEDNTLGPVVHVVCKPNGSQWVERKSGDQWPAVEGTGVRYACTTPPGGRWTGEVGIPWKLVSPRGRPVMLRFNFAQHRQADGESSSWCGPVDFGRDDRMMGLLYLTEPAGAGPSDTASGE